MPKVSVYLPDDLYDEARKRGIAISAVTQEALASTIRRQANREWVERMRSRRPRVHEPIDTSALMAEVRDEFGT